MDSGAGRREFKDSWMVLMHDEQCRLDMKTVVVCIAGDGWCNLVPLIRGSEGAMLIWRSRE